MEKGESRVRHYRYFFTISQQKPRKRNFLFVNVSKYQAEAHARFLHLV
jgi:hypothetical protein